MTDQERIEWGHAMFNRNFPSKTLEEIKCRKFMAKLDANFQALKREPFQILVFTREFFNFDSTQQIAFERLFAHPGDIFEASRPQLAFHQGYKKWKKSPKGDFVLVLLHVCFKQIRWSTDSLLQMDLTDFLSIASNFPGLNPSPSINVLAKGSDELISSVDDIVATWTLVNPQTQIEKPANPEQQH